MAENTRLLFASSSKADSDLEEVADDALEEAAVAADPQTGKDN